MNDTQALKEEQLLLAKKIKTKNIFSEIKFIAGTDQVVVNKQILAVISVLSYPKLEPVEQKYAITAQEHNYNPGYIFYQEGPAIMEAYEKLVQKPDVLLIKGDGILHPRRIGIASHLGLKLNVATIGIAKAMLCGELKQDTAYVNDEARGKLLVTKKHGKPLFISPGHGIDLETAYDVTKKSVVSPHKLPEPMTDAHKLIVKLKKFEREKDTT